MEFRAQRALLIAMCLATACSAAIDGTVLATADGTVVLLPLTSSSVGTPDSIFTKSQWGASWKDNAGVYGPCFSPDGRRIAISNKDWWGPFDSKSQKIYTMSNDGSQVDTICAIENPDCRNLCLSWANTGYLYWSEETERIFRANLLTKQREVVATLDDFTGPKPDPLRIDALKMSLDGTRAGFMLCGVGYCMSLDFGTSIIRDYGGGCQGAVSPNGQLITHSSSMDNYSFHQVGYIHDFESQAIVDTFFAPGAAPGQTGSVPRIVYFRFSHSSNTHIVFRGEDALNNTAYVHDLAGNETVLLGDCGPFDFRANALPSAAEPFIALDRPYLMFTSADGSAPPAQDILATNIGAGSVGALSTTTNPPSATWLDVSVNGITLTTTVDPSGLPAGTHYATVAVSSANALNDAVYEVTFNVLTQVDAPTNLYLGKAWRPASCIGLAWTDNSDNETEFVIERKPSGGAFALVATVSGNTTEYMDTVPAVGVYTYRVRAVAGTDTSGYSNEETLRTTFPQSITVISPSGDETWNAGTTQYIQWRTDGVPNVQITYSVDNGETWLLVTETGSVSIDSSDWGNYPWNVLDLNQDSVLIRVHAYADEELYGESGHFTVTPATRSSTRAGLLPARTALPSPTTFALRSAARLEYELAAGEQASLEIYSLDGTLVRTVPLAEVPGRHVSYWRGGSPAMYLLKLVTESR